MTETWLHKTTFHLFKKATHEYKLLEDGEKVLIGVSGGVDSLMLLHLLNSYNLRRKKGWKLLAVHIDPGFPNWRTERLKNYFQSLRIPHLISKIDTEKKFSQITNKKRLTPPLQTVSSAKTQVPSARRVGAGLNYCFFCSRERRKRLFEIANQNDIQKIALAHHLEDVNETFFLNLIYASKMTTCVPKQDFFQGLFYIVRPLYYFDKELIRNYSEIYKLPKIKNRCPYEKDSQRIHIREFLNKLYKKNSRIKTNIFWGIKNVKLNYLP